MEEPLADGVSWSGITADAHVRLPARACDCEVVGSRLHGVRFTGAELERLRLLDVALLDCELSGAILEEATFSRVQLVRCRLSGVIGAGITAEDVVFTDCKVDDANFRMAKWERCRWVDSILRDTDFYGGTLTRCGFRRCDLTGAEFSAAACDGLTLHGSTLDGIRGAASLGGCVIGSDQVVPLALALFGVHGIRVDDDVPETDG